MGSYCIEALRYAGFKSTPLCKWFLKSETHAVELLALYWYIRDLLTEEQMVNIIERWEGSIVPDLPNSGFDMTKYVNTCRAIARIWGNDKLYRAMLTARYTPDAGDIATLVNKLELADEEIRTRFRWSTWMELHDKLAQTMNERKYAKREYKRPELNKLQNAEIVIEGKTYKILVPESNHDILVWANLMHNCLYSYEARHSAGEITILGVESGGKLLYVLEYRGKHIVQIKAAYNKGVPNNITQALEKYLNKANLSRAALKKSNTRQSDGD